MRNGTIARRLAAFALTAGLCLSAGPALSQTAAPTITLQAGDILELLPVGLPASRITWSLTQGNVFKGASRDPSFVSRFVQTGTYSLHLETLDLSVPATEDFTIVVKDRTDPTDADSHGPLLTPAADTAGRIILPDDRLLTVRTLSPAERIVLDLDTIKDSDNDGDARNDADTKNTLLATDGVPLHLWFAPQAAETMYVGIMTPGTSTPTTPVTILSTAAAVATGATPPPLDIIALDDGTGVIKFSLGFRGNPAPDYPMLLKWDFGDTSTSLLMAPSHQYLETGEYSVTVKLVNLATGQEAAERTERVTISEVPSGGVISGSASSTSSSVSNDSSSSTSSTPAAAQTGGGSWLSLVLLGLFIFILFAVIGAVVVMVIGRMGGNGLQKQLTAIDDRLRVTPVVETAPEKSKEPTAPPALVVTTEPRRPVATPAPAPEPVIDTANAPSWLKKGLTEAAVTGTIETPVPAPIKPAATVAETLPVTPVKTTVTVKTTPASAPAPVVPAPPRPAPAAAPISTPTPIPAPAPTPASPKITASVESNTNSPAMPAWLTPMPSPTDAALPAPTFETTITSPAAPATPKAQVVAAARPATPTPSVVVATPIATPSPAPTPTATNISAAPTVNVTINNTAPAPAAPLSTPKAPAPTPAPVAANAPKTTVSVTAAPPSANAQPTPAPAVTPAATPTPAPAARPTPPKLVTPPANPPATASTAAPAPIVVTPAAVTVNVTTAAAPAPTVSTAPVTVNVSAPAAPKAPATPKAPTVTKPPLQTQSQRSQPLAPTLVGPRTTTTPATPKTPAEKKTPATPKAPAGSVVITPAKGATVTTTVTPAKTTPVPPPVPAPSAPSEAIEMKPDTDMQVAIIRADTLGKPEKPDQNAKA